MKGSRTVINKTVGHCCLQAVTGSASGGPFVAGEGWGGRPAFVCSGCSGLELHTSILDQQTPQSACKHQQSLLIESQPGNLAVRE